MTKTKNQTTISFFLFTQLFYFDNDKSMLLEITSLVFLYGQFIRSSIIESLCH